MENNERSKKSNKLLRGGILFGFVLAFSLIVTAGFAVGIRVNALRSAVLRLMFLWALETAIMVGFMFLLIRIWKKMIKPNR